MFSLMLAPMERYTDSALRTLCFRHGADMTFTEMAQVGTLLRGNRLTAARVAARDATPVQIQLLAAREDELDAYIRGFQPFPGFAGFNLNLSCPSPDVIRQGKGAALIKRTAKVERLASIIRRGGHPVSLKLRLGTNPYEKSKKVYLNCLRGVEADFYVVHAKTASQGSAEAADDSVYPECLDAAGGRPVIANGDISSAEEVELLRGLGLQGVMIGRAALRDPSIFDALKNETGINNPAKPVPKGDEIIEEYIGLAKTVGSEEYRARILGVIGKVNKVEY